MTSVPIAMYKIIGQDQRQYGPLTAEQVRAWITEGRVNSQTLIWKEGAPGWTPLVSLAEFTGALPPPIATTRSTQSAPTNKFALAGMISGILSMLSFGCCCCWMWSVFIMSGSILLDILGIIFSTIALSQLKKDPAQQGKAMAVAGLVCSIVALLLRILVLAIGITAVLTLLGWAAASAGKH